MSVFREAGATSDLTLNRGGYGSLLSQGRRKSSCLKFESEIGAAASRGWLTNPRRETDNTGDVAAGSLKFEAY
jgi:hypothetical protein